MFRNPRFLSSLLSWLMLAVACPAQNLVINGSFETPGITNGYAILPRDSFAPWQTTDDGIELWEDGMEVDGSFVTYSVDGTQNLEVLANSKSATVWQAISTVPGEDYSFSFYHTPRSTVHSVLTVSVNDKVLATLDEDGLPLSTFQWRKFKANFTATSTTTTLSFSDLSSKGVGTHIDHVVLERLPLRAQIRITEVEVCWETVTNRIYQVQYRPTLGTNDWTNLGPPRPGTGAPECLRDPVTAEEGQRTYRIITAP